MHLGETPPGRPIDALLAGYAAGTLTAPLHALVASHLELRPENRGFVDLLETAAGSALARQDGADLPRRDIALAAIMDRPEPPSTGSGTERDALLPAALRRLAGRGAADLPWRFKLPGIREYRLAGSEAGEAVFYWVRAGRRLPQHTHEGEEYTLLLQGGFTDPLGHYRRGDIAIGDAELDHDPVADRDEDCICFAVTDAPLRLTGPIPSLLRRVFGR